MITIWVFTLICQWGLVEIFMTVLRLRNNSRPTEVGVLQECLKSETWIWNTPVLECWFSSRFCFSNAMYDWDSRRPPKWYSNWLGVSWNTPSFRIRRYRASDFPRFASTTAGAAPEDIIVSPIQISSLVLDVAIIYHDFVQDVVETCVLAREEDRHIVLPGKLSMELYWIEWTAERVFLSRRDFLCFWRRFFSHILYFCWKR